MEWGIDRETAPWRRIWGGLRDPRRVVAWVSDEIDDGLIVHLLLLVVHAKHNRAVDADS